MTALSSVLKVRCSVCCEKKYDLNREKQIAAIQRINKSIGWAHYNWAILTSVGTKDLRFAVLDGEICGYVLVRTWRLTNDAYVPFIAVEASKQRHKIGSALMNRLFEKATKHKLKEVSLDFRAKLVCFYTGLPPSHRLEKEGHGTYSNGDVRYHIRYSLSDSPDDSKHQK
ncbi:MAG: GNAT family N-acetyltransferase [Verrucomicrobiota bacterium]|nr:GNAT family N-acetyltransferase [Verrucomicrobiota bacterium]